MSESRSARRLSTRLLGACVAGAIAAVTLGAPDTATRANSEASAKYQAKHPNVKTVGGGVSAPVLVKRVEPEYPEEVTKTARTDSSPLTVEAIVSSSGSIIDPVVLSTANSDLHPYVLAAVRKWRYKPAREKGKTVPVFIMITFRVGAPHA